MAVEGFSAMMVINTNKKKRRIMYSDLSKDFESAFGKYEGLFV